ERESLLAAVREDPVARWNHPRWWIEQLRHDHPSSWQAVLEAADAPPPMTLRVNRRRAGVAGYLSRLTDAGINARQVGEQALTLDKAVAVETLPGWADGDVSVQDAGAPLAAPLLAPADGERVLDACAGPGGKTTHLPELADWDLSAPAGDGARRAPVRQTLARLGQRAGLAAGDARGPDGWWDGLPFDRILVAAPCTASGIVRRHPDIRWLRR